MRWVKKGLWIAAWGCWVWLGFGLYRELPRSQGQIIRHLPFPEGEESLGFITEIPGLVTQIKRANDDRPTLRLWDATAAILVRDAVCPILGANLVNGEIDYVVAIPPKASNGDQATPLAFDLYAKNWVELPSDARTNPTFHWHKPWGLFFDWNKQGRPENILVVNLNSGKPLFRWKPRLDAPDSTPSGRPFFIGDGAVAVPTMRTPPTGAPDKEHRHCLEVWRVVGESRKPKVFDDVIVGDDPHATQTGRVVWHNVGKSPASVAVFDITRGQTIFSHPPKETPQEIGPNGEWPGPQLSTDGSAVLGVMSAMLWEVETGRLIWAPRPGESIRNHDSFKDVFETKETWNVGEGMLTGQTYAVRSLKTGQLMFRSMQPTLLGKGTIHRIFPFRFDPESGAVHRFPPDANWLLLALCQTILALPLVLLWATLRRRRNRRLRMASVKR